MATKEEIIRNSPFKPTPKKILEYRRESSDTFTIKLDWQLEHKPGQFVFCSILGIGEAPISICSYSNEYVELNIREVGNVTRALSKVKAGDYLLVRGPYGKPYPMEYFRGNNLIIVGGGCGVAPLKGVIEYIEKHRYEFKDVHLFFGFRSDNDVLFGRKMGEWKEKFNTHISFDKVIAKACYDGAKGFITDSVEQYVKDNLDKVVFICGPPIMIERTTQILLRKGFHEDQIFISAERLMYCGMGKCGRCMIHGKYTCLDGAVFRYDELKNYHDD
jgi:anaerobic sulfite reductase subunit B